MPVVLRGRLALAALVVALAAVAGYVAWRLAPADETPRRTDAARLMNDLMSGKVPVGGPFTLTDQRGKRVSLADFHGRIVVLYFGYTFCPDVCPTDLHAIAGLLELLGADGSKVQPLFVTLDPERDTPARLGPYAESFNPRFVALTGSAQEIREVATQYKVFFEKVRPPGASDYMIDHTAFTFVIDARGNYAGFFPPGTSGERMAALVRDLLATI
jgi:cytochrome oxidase Cu insertion factor (SCO1/SenC/PrrC family)